MNIDPKKPSLSKPLISCHYLSFTSSYDILRISKVDLNCRYSKYHNFSDRSDFSDMLELSAFLKGLNYCSSTAETVEKFKNANAAAQIISVRHLLLPPSD